MSRTLSRALPAYRRSPRARYHRRVAIQRMRLAVPPTLAQLLSDDVYARYSRRDPVMPAGIRGESPWQIIARRAPERDGRAWALAMMPSYASAWRRARAMISSHADLWSDVAICSRAAMFRPPAGFTWNLRYHWCGRCRRPTLMQPMAMHPVLRGQLEASLRHATMLSTDVPRRCYYCGMRQSSMPHYRPRMKVSQA